jgi:DNA-binding NarL/FixJ family response regulator
VLLRNTSDIRVAIVSQNRIFGESLAFALDDNTGISVDAVVCNPTDLGLDSGRVSVILIELEGLTTVIDSAVALMRRAIPRARIVVLSSRFNPFTLRRSIESGADGHVSKETGLGELRRAIHCVADGLSYVDPRAASDAARAAALPGGDELGIARLSPREREVLLLLVEGQANREIAATLHVAHKTVKNHVSNILSKLQTTSRTQAVIHALRRGIV